MNRLSAQRGFNKLGFVLAISVIGIVITAFLSRVDGIQAESERTEVELTIRNMRVGLQLAVGDHIMGGRDEQIRNLLERNPFRFLERLPSGYEGEAMLPSRAGGWVYDPLRRVLAYQPRLKESFPGRELLRWHYEAVAAPGDRLAGLRISSIE